MDPVKQAYSNIRALLLEGSFPGKYAPVVAEAVGFVSRLIEEMDKQNGEGQQDGSGVRSEENPSGMDGGPVPNRGKQGRRKKGK